MLPALKIEISTIMNSWNKEDKEIGNTKLDQNDALSQSSIIDSRYRCDY